MKPAYIIFTIIALAAIMDLWGLDKIKELLRSSQAIETPLVEEEAVPELEPAPRTGSYSGQKNGIEGEGSSLTGTKPAGVSVDGLEDTDRLNRDLDNAYKARIRSKLVRLRKYPKEARDQQLQGVATVRFTVNRQGVVSSSRLVRSSGHDIFDKEVMDLIKRCSPFPPMPKEMKRNSITLTVPIDFKRPRKQSKDVTNEKKE